MESDETGAGKQFVLGLFVAAVTFFIAAYAIFAALAGGFRTKVLMGEGDWTSGLAVGFLAVGALAQLTSGLMLSGLLALGRRSSRVAFESWAAALLITFVSLPLASATTMGTREWALAIGVPIVAAAIGRAVHKLFPAAE